ncbi:MAG: hypothetical protein AAGJ52_13505, partial [Pseudomonadota bacterium]
MNHELKNDLSIFYRIHRVGRPFIGRRTLVLLLLLMMSSLSWAQASSVAAIAPGAVVDAPMQRVFLLAPNGLEARTIDSGDLLWSLGGRVEPLGLHNGHLLALREGNAPTRAELLTIDATQGSILNAQILSFPDEVRVGI